MSVGPLKEISDTLPAAAGWPGVRGRTALITGGAQGIGFAIARGFLQAGAQVIVIDRHRDTERIIDELRVEFGRAAAARSFVADVKDQSALDDIREQLRAEMIPVDILIPNAGLNIRKPLLDLPPTAVREIVDTNLLGALSTLQTFGPLLFDREDARVVVTSSVSAVQGTVLRVPYTATKAALSGLVRSLALEWGPRGVTVNAVGPGIIKTPLTAAYMDEHPEKQRTAIANTPLRRIGTPEEVADVVLFLASKAARFITGQTIFVDGGLTAGNDWW